MAAVASGERELRSAGSVDDPAKAALPWNDALVLRDRWAVPCLSAQHLLGDLTISALALGRWGFRALLLSFLSFCCCFEGYVLVPLTHHFSAPNCQPLAVIVGERAHGHSTAATFHHAA